MAAPTSLSWPPVPREVFRQSAIITSPIAAVWAALDEPATWEAVGGVDRVLDPILDVDGQLRGFSFEVVAGGRRYLGNATPLDRRHLEHMAWNVETSELRGSTGVALEEVQDGTRVTVTIEVESKGLLSTMFFPVIAGAIGKGLPRSVEQFAAGFNESKLS